jgi:hypothetical protein
MNFYFQQYSWLNETITNTGDLYIQSCDANAMPDFRRSRIIWWQVSRKYYEVQSSQNLRTPLKSRSSWRILEKWCSKLHILWFRLQGFEEGAWRIPMSSSPKGSRRGRRLSGKGPDVGMRQRNLCSPNEICAAQTLGLCLQCKSPMYVSSVSLQCKSPVFGLHRFRWCIPTSGSLT